MGVFGAKLFEDDFALDVQEAYLNAIQDGLSTEAATQQLIEDFHPALDTSDDGVVFWLALAVTQWDVGRPVESVLSRALKILETPITADDWEDLYKERNKELKRIKAKLLKKPPKEKKNVVIRHKEPLSGDIFRYTVTLDKRQRTPRYFYGRVITNYYAAYYESSRIDDGGIMRMANAVEQGRDWKDPEMKKLRQFELADILLLDVALIENAYLGFHEGCYKVIGNIPLEEKFTKPIYRYQRPAGDRICRVYDIWQRDQKRAVDISELDPSILPGSTCTHSNILRKLGIQ